MNGRQLPTVQQHWSAPETQLDVHCAVLVVQTSRVTRGESAVAGAERTRLERKVRRGRRTLMDFMVVMGCEVVWLEALGFNGMLCIQVVF